MKLNEIPFCHYAGIGSRETPENVLELMSDIAEKLFFHNQLTLRSGGADGADKAFETGAARYSGHANLVRMEIYIPWEGFSDLHLDQEIICITDPKIIKESEEIAAKFHGGWNNLKQGARKLMARNTFQVLGGDLKTYSKFVLCYTQDGADGKKIPTSRNTGGTGQAIRIAAHYNIPVINLYHKQHFDYWQEWSKK